MSQETVWLLSEEGILDFNGKPVYDVPFQPASVIAGDTSQDGLSVIVNNHEVWTYVSGTWNQQVSTDVTLNCVCWTPDNRLLVGTECARLAWVADGELDFIGGFDTVPGRQLWKTPWGGPPDVRSLAVSTDGTIYANIHVGWVVRSRDGGKTWVNLQEGLEMDVHQVSAHPSDPATIFAATARGFYLSRDYGDTFIHQRGGMPYYYQRACACFPESEVYLVSTSRGPHSRVDAQLYRSDDAGENWALVSGLPEQIGENIDTFQIITVGGTKALVVVDDTTLYQTDDLGLNWQKIADYPRLFGGVVVQMPQAA
jgi:hypothetical protein